MPATLLVVQLSDIHIRDGREAVLKRADAIAEALRGIDPDLRACVIALTGDVAWSGLSAQYAAAGTWLAATRDAIARVLGAATPIHIVAIPGNHDCDLASPTPARSTLLKSISDDATVLEDPATAVTCASVQDAFFAFRDAYASDGLEPNATRLSYTYAFPIGGGLGGDLLTDRPGRVVIRCLNTAWVSTNPEVPGHMVFPPEAVVATGGSDGVLLTLMHHPSNWLTPMNARDVRARLDAAGGIILLGHEHTRGARVTEDDVGRSTLVLDAPALWAHAAPGREPASAFNAIVLDPAAEQFRAVTFEWNGRRYADVVGRYTEWTPWEGGHASGAGDFPVRNATLDWLRDPGIDLRHPTRGALKLPDIFVYPDLQEIDFEVKSGGKSGRPKVRSARDLPDLAADGYPVLVTGERESGKTCLLKQLYRDLLGRNVVPIAVNGRDARLTGDGMRDAREYGRLFEEQYVSGADAFRAVPYDRRAILIDNFHALPPEASARVLWAAGQSAARVYVFANDLTQQVQDLLRAQHRREVDAPLVRHYRVLPYGHVRREELIDVYVRLAGASDHAQQERLRDEMRKLLDTALGKYAAPALPVAIISILQARAFNDSFDVSQSTYGYYYDRLINRTLARAVSTAEFDVSLAYCTALAAALFEAGKTTWDENWFLAFHQAFNRDRGLALRYTDALGALLDRGVVIQRGDHYEFGYRYYYYFVARRLAEEITDPAVQARVRDLAARLHEEDAANTLLFLSHFTKSAPVLDAMLAQADRLFAQETPATLTADTVRLPANAAVYRPLYVERPVAETRQAYLEHMDGSDAHAERPELAHGDAEERESREARSSEAAELVAYLDEMHASLRTVQILGQLLKNFPGTLNAEQKTRITKAATGVGLRLMASLHRLLRENAPDAVRAFADTIRREHPALAVGQVAARALDTLGQLLFLASWGIVQRIAANVGTPLLTPIYDEVTRENPTPAMRLVRTAVDLDRFGGLAGGGVIELHNALERDRHQLADRVLRMLVVSHLHMYEVERGVKERVCARLDLRDPSGPTLPEPRLRRVKSGKPRGARQPKRKR